MQAWRKRKGLRRSTRFSCVFEPMEREVLGNLAASVAEAIIARAQAAPKDELAELTGMPSGHKEAPQDPALARLLPDFEREGDEEFAGDNSLLRSLHEQDICKEKLRNLHCIIQALGPGGGVDVSIDEDEAHSWLMALNDIRLYLVSQDPPEDPQAREERELLSEWLAFNQDSLLNAMMGQ